MRAGEIDGHDLDPDRMVAPDGQRRTLQAAKAGSVDAPLRVRVRRSGLDLHQHASVRSGFGGEDVDLDAGDPSIAGENGQAVPLQATCGHPFPGSAQGSPLAATSQGL